MSKKRKDTNIHMDLRQLRAVAEKSLHKLSRYAAILFFLLVAGVYSFILLRINTLVNAQPSQSDIDAQSTSTTIPRVDPKVAEQLEKLEDNSVNVQTLFNQARNNPFQ